MKLARSSTWKLHFLEIMLWTRRYKSKHLSLHNQGNFQKNQPVRKISYLLWFVFLAGWPFLASWPFLLVYTNPNVFIFNFSKRDRVAISVGYSSAKFSFRDARVTKMPNDQELFNLSDGVYLWYNYLIIMWCKLLIYVFNAINY